MHLLLKCHVHRKSDSWFAEAHASSNLSVWQRAQKDSEKCGDRQGGAAWWQIWATQTADCCPSQLFIPFCEQSQRREEEEHGGGRRFVEYICHSAPHNLGVWREGRFLRDGEGQTDWQRLREIFALMFSANSCAGFHSSWGGALLCSFVRVNRGWHSWCFGNEVQRYEAASVNLD